MTNATFYQSYIIKKERTGKSLRLTRGKTRSDVKKPNWFKWTFDFDSSHLVLTVKNIINSTVLIGHLFLNILNINRIQSFRRIIRHFVSSSVRSTFHHFVVSQRRIWAYYTSRKDLCPKHEIKFMLVSGAIKTILQGGEEVVEAVCHTHTHTSYSSPMNINYWEKTEGKEKIREREKEKFRSCN